MAGTIRKRSWTTRKGEEKTAWVADYFNRGKRHTRQFSTKKAARAALLTIQGEVRDGVHTPLRNSITVAEAGKLWLVRGAAEGLERATLANYELRLRRFVLPLLGNVRLSELTPPDVEAWRDHLLRCHTRGNAQSALLALKSLLANAQRRGSVVYNAAVATRINSKSRDREPLEIGRNVPSKQEVQTILTTADPRWRPAFVTAAFTGMRTSELRGLTWASVDLAARVIQVRQRADQYGGLGAPKSAASRRDIPLMPIVLHALLEWKMAYPFGPGGFVFCSLDHTRRGQVLSHEALWNAFRYAQREARITDERGRPKYRFHVLRHFFASLGIEQGFNPKRLQALLGHSSVKMTYDVYGHLFPNPVDDHERLAAMQTMVMGSPRPVFG